MCGWGSVKQSIYGVARSPLTVAYATHVLKNGVQELTAVKTRRMRRRKRKSAALSKQTPTRSKFTSAIRRASIFRNGANQAVRLPQDLRFPEEVKEVRIRQQGENLVISPVRPDWASFFSLQVDVPDDFLEQRDRSPPQSREPP